MLERINRKLFLSSMMMGSDDAGDDHNNSLKLQELLSIMRLGAAALADTATASVMTLDEFTAADAQEIVSAAREQEKSRQAQLEQLHAGPDTSVRNSAAEEEENMRRVTRVFSRLFEGKHISRPVEHSKAWEQKENERDANAWEEIKKRARSDRLVTIDGMQFIADHVLTAADTVWTPFYACSLPWFTHRAAVTIDSQTGHT